jgi:hypothetical protein
VKIVPNFMIVEFRKRSLVAFFFIVNAFLCSQSVDFLGVPAKHE